jgi:hypothetical protein
VAFVVVPKVDVKRGKVEVIVVEVAMIQLTVGLVEAEAVPPAM